LNNSYSNNLLNPIQNSFLPMNNSSLNANTNMKFLLNSNNEFNTLNPHNMNINSGLLNNDYSLNTMSFNPMLTMNNPTPFNYNNFQSNQFNNTSNNTINTTNILSDTLKSLSSPISTNNPYSTFINTDKVNMGNLSELRDEDKNTQSIGSKSNIFNQSNVGNNKKSLMNKNSMEILQCLMKKE